ncbi:MAG: hypothetical protein EOM73_15530 [Bacteroidia bacterium]|nr:hypothetical protein [Bacteroidia bacterium]
MSKVDTAKMPVFYANVELLKVRLLRFLKDSKWTDDGLRKSAQTLDSPVLRTYLEILNSQAVPKNSASGVKK